MRTGNGTKTAAPTAEPGAASNDGQCPHRARSRTAHTNHNRDEFEALRDQVSLREFCEAHLEPMGRRFVCPVCGSGTGPKHTPAFNIKPDGIRWHCFVCGRGGDVFDLYGILNGCDGDEPEQKAEQLRGVAGWAGLPIRDEDGSGTTRRARKRHVAARPRAIPGEAAETARRRAEMVSRLARAREGIDNPLASAFLSAHGLSTEAACRHGLGFTGSYKLRGRRYPALLIPYPGSPWYYAARILDPTAPHKYDKPRVADLGHEPLWNPAALRAPAFVVVEGQFDALAVAECGFEAVAMGTTGSRPLLQELERVGYAGAVVVMTDHDGPGEDGCMRLMFELAGLRAKGLRLMPYPLPWPDAAPKDAAEWLAADPSGLRAAIASALAAAMDGLRRANEPSDG